MSLLCSVLQTLSTRNLLTIYTHESEQAAVDYITTHLGRWTFALIVFREISASKINYVIRQNYTTLPSTGLVIDDFAVGLDKGYQEYYTSGFLSIQGSVDDWAMEYVGATSSGGQCANVPHTTSMPFPTFDYKENPFYSTVGFLLGVAFASKNQFTLSSFNR
jgi:hypothetical protein